MPSSDRTFQARGFSDPVSVRFGKRKLDIICKDHKNKKTDGNFAVHLSLSEDPEVIHAVPVIV
jgi:hypothetical protein